MSTTPLLNITEIGETQNNKYATANNAFRALEQAANASLANAAVGAGPWALTEAQITRYAVFRASGGSAAFNITLPSTVNTINASRVVYVINADTTYTATVKASTGTGATVALLPGESGAIYQSFEDCYLLSKGQAASNPPYDVGFFIPGKPNDNEVIFTLVAVRDVLFADEFLGSKASVGTLPTDGTATFTIKKNGSSVGTISITTGGVITFATSGTTTALTAGDTLSVTTPTPQDSTLANVAVNFKGERT